VKAQINEVKREMSIEVCPTASIPNQGVFEQLTEDLRALRPLISHPSSLSSSNASVGFLLAWCRMMRKTHGRGIWLPISGTSLRESRNRAELQRFDYYTNFHLFHQGSGCGRSTTRSFETGERLGSDYCYDNGVDVKQTSTRL
jgi:hypothetical protein